MATVHLTSKYNLELWAVVVEGRCVATFWSEQAAKRRAEQLNKGK